MGQSAKKLSRPSTVYDHIKELQKRLAVCAIVLVVVSIIVYLFYGKILDFLTSPLGAPLYYSTPAGGFTFVVRICLTGALIVTIPVLIYNIIMFIRPAFIEILPMKRVLKTTCYSTLLALLGAIFAFYCILPGTLSFLKGFQVTGLNALISADDYLGFVTNIIIMFVFVFQIPLVMSFIDKIKPLKPKKLFKMEKWVILASLIIALLAPFTYDLATSLLIAVPIVVLYNLSVIAVVVRHLKVSRKDYKTNYATIAKPSFNNSSESALPTADLDFENISDELTGFEKPKTVSNMKSNYNTAMDIKHQSTPEKVEIPSWVIERKARLAAINNNVPVFSDFRRRTNINRALASQ